VKNSELITGKGFDSVTGIPSIVCLAVLMAVILTVGLAWVSGGYLLRAARRKARKEETPLEWYTLPQPSAVLAGDSI
jgi:hypothetical protein